MKCLNLFNIILSLMTFFSVQATYAADIKMGVNAPRGALDAQKWIPVAEQLMAQTGKTIEVIPYHPAKINEAIANNEIEFALINPGSAILVIEKFKAKPLGTLKAKGTSFFAGVIFAKKGTGITKVADLRGKKVKGFQLGLAPGGYIFQTYHLIQQGIDPHKDFAAFTDSKKMDEIVLAVNLGLIDVGFVRTGILESMVKEGSIKLDNFVIIDQKKDKLKHVHSTDLYPEWFLVASSQTDVALTKKVQDAALKMKASDEAAKIAEIDGFVETQNLDNLRKAMKALKMAPYEGG